MALLLDLLLALLLALTDLEDARAEHLDLTQDLLLLYYELYY